MLNVLCHLSNTILKVKKTKWLHGYKMVLSLSFVYPHDLMADWELWLTATAQHPEKIIYHVFLAQERLEFKIEVQFLLNVYYFHITLKSNHGKLGTICTIYSNMGKTEVRIPTIIAMRCLKVSWSPRYPVVRNVRKIKRIQNFHGRESTVEMKAIDKMRPINTGYGYGTLTGGKSVMLQGDRGVNEVVETEGIMEDNGQILKGLKYSSTS